MERRYQTMKDSTNFTSSEFIHLNHSGINMGAVPSFVTYRPKGRVDWHILYQVNGECTAVYGGESFTLTAGDALIYPPNVPHLYEYTQDSQTFWVHFAGSAAEELMESLGLSHGVRRGTLDTAVIEAFRRLNGLSGADPASRAVQNGTLLTLLGFLSRISVGERAELSEDIALGIRLMREEYSRSISVSECASLCRMSESGFTHRFSERVGVSPYKFLTDIRMEKARDLLLHTRLSVSEIAPLCGYSDPLYFSRIFKKENGVSPRAFRK